LWYYRWVPSSSPEKVTLRPDRRGICWRDKEYEGFPDLEGLSPRARLAVARWAKQLAPDALTPAQQRLLDKQPRREVSAARLRALRQDEILSSPPIRGLWRELTQEEQTLVLHPEEKVGHYYPLQTSELVRLTGLSSRQVQHWTERNLLPHWRDERGHRRFGSAAAIVAFALRDSKQHQRQFFSDVGNTNEPLREIAEIMNMALLQALERTDTAADDAAEIVAELEKLSAGLRETLDATRLLVEERLHSAEHKRLVS
jgi:DNA-binding transcriptional MerR regulator